MITPPSLEESPFTLFLRGEVDCPVESRTTDIVAENEHAIALVCSRQIAGHEGHMLVLSKAQYPTLLDLPDVVGSAVFSLTKKVAAAMVQALRCDGVTAIQNNGRASDQTVFHYHVHLVPRYHDDSFLRLYADHSTTQVRRAAEERAVWAAAIRSAMASVTPSTSHPATP